MREEGVKDKGGTLLAWRGVADVKTKRCAGGFRRGICGESERWTHRFNFVSALMKLAMARASAH
jgi:hypothetical protein